MLTRFAALLLVAGLAVATPSAPRASAAPAPPLPPSSPCRPPVGPIPAPTPTPTPTSPPLIFPPPVTFQLPPPTPAPAPEMCLAPDQYSYSQGIPLPGAIVDITVTVLRTRASARRWAHRFRPHHGRHPAGALGPDELISDGTCACPGSTGFQYLLQMTYRNLVLTVTYNGYDGRERRALAHDAMALLTDYAAQVLVRTRAYARTHTHDRWPIRMIAGRPTWT